MPSSKEKPTAAEVTKLRAVLTKRGGKKSDLDTLLSGATGKERQRVIDDLVAWLRERPKAK